MPKGQPGSGTTIPRARSGTSPATMALGFRGTAAAHNWWALPLGSNKLDYLIAGSGGFQPVATMEQMMSICSDILLGHFVPIAVQEANATALANRSVLRDSGNAIPEVTAGENGAATTRRVRNRVSGSRVATATT